jgi:hypothetical protein
MSLRSLSFVAAVPFLALFASGCGSTIYQPSKVAGFDPDGTAEIDDTDVAKAFAAKPQLGAENAVAYFSFDPTKSADVERTLRAVPGVTSVYSIPALAVTGQRRFEDPAAPAAAAAPISLKKLRLLAARAHCDLLVVVDYSHRTDVSANGWAALDVLLLPALFVPFRDLDVKSAVDAFVVDTRNGYLYGHVALDEHAEAKRKTIYATDDDVVAAQWTNLRQGLEAALVQVVTAERKASAR